MTVNELYKWIANPLLLTKISLSELKQLINEYPYFQTARMLYLKNLSVTGDVRFQKELKRMSVYVPDRKRLYMLIGSKQFENQENIKVQKNKDLKIREKTEEPAAIAGEESIRIVFEEEKSETKTEQKIKNQYITIAPADYISWLESNAEDIVSHESEDKHLKYQNLIDSFIESAGKLQINKQGNEDKKSKNDKKSEVIPLNETSEKNLLDDSYFTETLAHVYFSQKRYDKALEIIRVLSLKYPEKNVYFADQIQYLEKIINIKK
ncbi:MAG: hypothetical protein LBD80_01630 [Tannerella sp.]|jgi:hypothetical protein|nr:hypothetical protein [Tannerella sp.]